MPANFCKCFNHRYRIKQIFTRMSSFTVIDGSILEGGGQILRISISLSAILRIPVRINSIRAKRSKPGLAAQHMKGIELVARLCGAEVSGLHIGSTSVEFTPGLLQGGDHTVHIGTAGSISLLLQISLPCCLFARNATTLNLHGGTNAEMAPQIDFMTEVFRPVMEKFGASFDFELFKRGYYPRGGGHIAVTVNPIKCLNAISMLQLGNIYKLTGWSYVAGSLPINLAHSMAEGAKTALATQLRHVTPHITCYKESPEVARDNCSGIILVAESSTSCIVGSSGLGKRGVEAHVLGHTAGTQLCQVLQDRACVDEYTQDQIIILMVLARGKSIVRTGPVTMHTETAIHIAQLLTGNCFTITPQGPNENTIEVEGMGYINQFMM